jgi:hypothetical protein
MLTGFTARKEHIQAPFDPGQATSPLRSLSSSVPLQSTLPPLDASAETGAGPTAAEKTASEALAAIDSPMQSDVPQTASPDPLRTEEGPRNESNLVSDRPPAVSQEAVRSPEETPCSAAPTQSPATSAPTTFTSISQHPLAQTPPARSLGNTVSFRFVADHISNPRERPFTRCDNVKLLFTNAKQGGLLNEETSMAHCLAFSVPGVAELVRVCIGDDMDFDDLVLVLKGRVALLTGQDEKLVVEVRADYSDEIGRGLRST